MEEGKVVEFTFAKVGKNGSSLTVGYQSNCHIIESPSVRNVFKDFELWDGVIFGSIDGFQGMSTFIACDNCLGGIQDSVEFCKTCKKKTPSGNETFR